MAELKLELPNVTDPPSFAVTRGMQALFADGARCKRVADAHEDFEAFLSQLQRDSTSEANMATAGPMLVAIRKVGDLMHFVALRGEAQSQLDTPKTT